MAERKSLHCAERRITDAKSEQRRFQFQKRAQQLVRFNDVSATIIFVCIDNPAPAIVRDSAAIADQPASLSLSANDFPVFHWRHDARICFHRFRDLAQGDTGTGDERFKQGVA
jgi:hypothetical protein